MYTIYRYDTYYILETPTTVPKHGHGHPTCLQNTRNGNQPARAGPETNILHEPPNRDASKHLRFKTILACSSEMCIMLPSARMTSAVVSFNSSTSAEWSSPGWLISSPMACSSRSAYASTTHLHAWTRRSCESYCTAFHRIAPNQRKQYKREPICILYIKVFAQTKF